MQNIKAKCVNALFAALALTQLTACFGPNEATSSATSESIAPSINALSFATWNMEHLAYPADTGCKPRSKSEIAAMQAYAASLDADIIALQEVASVKAIAQVFPEDQWQIIISKRADSEVYSCRESGNTSTQQKVAFAVRKSIPVLNTHHYDELALGLNGLRYGLSVTVDTADGATEVLNVHLKSGCFVDDYEKSDRKACPTFAKQAVWLDKWFERKEASKQPYIVMGDFNHRLATDNNRLMQELANNSNGAASTLKHITQNVVSCHPRYPAPIDHQFAGGFSQAIPTNVQMRYFADKSETAMLSDHCAVTFTLKAE
ncbi:endonuclease/exonuclease/phosphatase family protein [Pseudoalteromonas tunicata]|uniref:Endonuclease/exonuclease/phosphatase domain-containing protein n=2 Tax=Pseudoalteromonas tunicata TaxID=314281 RepID=A4CDS1_9GAMM|nr:endonuclease/exonuclease/phosphatase family protein [Pseudoalteromonas tunicata]ATC96395.1 hypothetical protein PTUN_a4188 [Pseudoalteromonas tunicata]AXT31888.1 endonuclease/exonuclease/phosphatase family protein [Pseudoalteromonas tunicata]EAR27113.1 hypothetical protein PTD2_05565 [Pseudoalteromonas tunicata D2]